MSCYEVVNIRIGSSDLVLRNKAWAKVVNCVVYTNEAKGKMKEFSCEWNVSFHAQTCGYIESVNLYVLQYSIHKNMLLKALKKPITYVGWECWYEMGCLNSINSECNSSEIYIFPSTLEINRTWQKFSIWFLETVLISLHIMLSFNDFFLKRIFTSREKLVSFFA